MKHTVAMPRHRRVAKRTTTTGWQLADRPSRGGPGSGFPRKPRARRRAVSLLPTSRSLIRLARQGLYKESHGASNSLHPHPGQVSSSLTKSFPSYSPSTQGIQLSSWFCVSMSSTAAASSLWFGELAAAVQGGWQAMAVADNRGGQQKKLTRATGPSCEQKQEAAAVAEAAVAGRKDGDVGRCCGAMSDTTVYLLLDRFAPN